MLQLLLMPLLLDLSTVTTHGAHGTFQFSLKASYDNEHDKNMFASKLSNEPLDQWVYLFFNTLNAPLPAVLPLPSAEYVHNNPTKF